MSSAKQNLSIAKLIVGAMTIDGALDAREREQVARTLENIGMGELIADVGAAIEMDDGTFNMFQECKDLLNLLGSERTELAPLIFRIVCDVIASDRFVSEREATYLSAMAKRLELPIASARLIFKQVMAERRSRLEVAGTTVSGEVNPQLKELLSFPGADALVGELAPDSIEEMIHSSFPSPADISTTADELVRALTILGLDGRATLKEAEEVWKETIFNLDLPRMAGLGETFVSAAIARISRINEAYKKVLYFHKSHGV